MMSIMNKIKRSTDIISAAILLSIVIILTFYEGTREELALGIDICTEPS